MLYDGLGIGSPHAGAHVGAIVQRRPRGCERHANLPAGWPASITSAGPPSLSLLQSQSSPRPSCASPTHGEYKPVGNTASNSPQNRAIRPWLQWLTRTAKCPLARWLRAGVSVVFGVLPTYPGTSVCPSNRGSRFAGMTQWGLLVLRAWWPPGAHPGWRQGPSHMERRLRETVKGRRGIVPAAGPYEVVLPRGRVSPGPWDPGSRSSCGDVAMALIAGG